MTIQYNLHIRFKAALKRIAVRQVLGRWVIARRRIYLSHDDFYIQYD